MDLTDLIKLIKPNSFSSAENKILDELEDAGRKEELKKALVFLAALKYDTLPAKGLGALLDYHVNGLYCLERGMSLCEREIEEVFVEINHALKLFQANEDYNIDIRHTPEGLAAEFAEVVGLVKSKPELVEFIRPWLEYHAIRIKQRKRSSLRRISAIGHPAEQAFVQGFHKAQKHISISIRAIESIPGWLYRALVEQLNRGINIDIILNQPVTGTAATLVTWRKWKAKRKAENMLTVFMGDVGPICFEGKSWSPHTMSSAQLKSATKGLSPYVAIELILEISISHILQLEAVYGRNQGTFAKHEWLMNALLLHLLEFYLPIALKEKETGELKVHTSRPTIFARGCIPEFVGLLIDGNLAWYARFNPKFELAQQGDLLGECYQKEPLKTFTATFLERETIFSSKNKLFKDMHTLSIKGEAKRMSSLESDFLEEDWELDFGKYLKWARKQMGYNTARELAEAAHIEHSRIREYECGMYIPDIPHLEKLAQVLGNDYRLYVLAGKIPNRPEVKRKFLSSLEAEE